MNYYEIDKITGQEYQVTSTSEGRALIFRRMRRLASTEHFHGLNIDVYVQNLSDRIFIMEVPKINEFEY